jgi:deoxyribonuclease-4
VPHIRIGAQVSGAGGVSRAVERAVAIEAEAVQVFVDPNRRYPRAPLPLDELDALRRGLRRARLPGYVHVPYLANVATIDAALLRRSIEMVARALAAADRAKLRGVVVHPGSHLGRGFDAALEGTASALAAAWRAASVDVPLLLENTAGGGGHIGSTPAELHAMVARLDGEGVRAGVCIDVQHAHAAGWDLSRAEGVERFAHGLREHGLDRRVGLVHANDSASASGSHHDRHANPGAGTIGARGFRLLAAVPALARVPWILEVPGEDHSGPRRRDVRRLRRIVSSV